jgi:UDP-N-acetyl-D-mannosaminuronate dehydrogenase
MDGRRATGDGRRATGDGRRATIPAFPPLTDDLLRRADCAVIFTPHRAFDYARIVALTPAIVDTRNATRDVQEGKEKVVVL